MSFVQITPATKLAAVKLYWQTGNVKKCADEYGVARNTLYDWVHLAEQHLESLFLESTPGRKPVTLAEQKEALQSQLDHVLDVYHNLSQSPRPLAQDLARCPKCHSTTLLRNGRVRSKRHGLLQRLWCRQCNASVYVDLKKTL
jgi:transposase-like protein